MANHSKSPADKNPTWEEEEAKLDAMIADLDHMEDFTEEEAKAYDEFLKALGV